MLTLINTSLGLDTILKTKVFFFFKPFLSWDILSPSRVESINLGHFLVNIMIDKIFFINGARNSKK